MDTYLYFLSVIGGFVAGIMNALAGFGSAVTLGIMIEFIGLPANVANGTNRINMLGQTSLSTLAYFRKGKLDLKKCYPIIIATFIGAMFGVYLAVIISNEAFKAFYKYLVYEELVEKDPTELIEGPKLGRKLPDTLSFPEIEKLFDVPPTDFKPAPKVTSAVVQLRPHAQPPHPATNLKTLSDILVAAFGQRRKTLRNSLSSLLTTDQLKDLAIDPSERAESLTVADYVRCANLLSQNAS